MKSEEENKQTYGPYIPLRVRIFHCKASLYEPKKTDIFKKTATHTRRLIFLNMEFEDFEKVGLLKFKEFVKEL